MIDDLTILTTADSNIKVMERFSNAISDFNPLKRGSITWVVVDGLRSYEKKPDFLDTQLPFSLKWITPDKKLPQLEAILLGLKMACSTTIIMDPDMGGNVDDFPRFLAKKNNGCEIVFGARVSRIGTHPARKLLTKLFNIFAKKLLKLPLNDINSPMILLSKYAISILRRTPDNCPSSRFYLYTKLRKHIGEVKITVEEPVGKVSTYTTYSRLRTGVTRTREIIAFLLYTRSIKP